MIVLIKCFIGTMLFTDFLVLAVLYARFIFLQHFFCVASNVYTLVKGQLEQNDKKWPSLSS